MNLPSKEKVIEFSVVILIVGTLVGLMVMAHRGFQKEEEDKKAFKIKCEQTGGQLVYLGEMIKVCQLANNERK